jgi:hypothetical protein
MCGLICIALYSDSILRQWKYKLQCLLRPKFRSHIASPPWYPKVKRSSRASWGARGYMFITSWWLMWHKQAWSMKPCWHTTH